jgi:glycosyltransferase involved in cell wall biosynthesis
MNKKPTVTIALPVYNEADGILKLLDSVLAQNQTNFKLEKIVVIADSPTDNTVELIKSLNSEIIQIIDDKSRKGQLERLNEVYKLVESDIIVQTDGDVVFGHKEVLASLVEKFLLNEKVFMVGGNAQPEQPRRFITRAIYHTVKAYEKIMFTIKDGNNIHTVHGCVLAFRKAFVKDFKVPTEAIVNDVFMYYKCLQEGHKYAFAENAIVYYKLPQSLSEHISQNIRYMSTANTVDKYFPKTLVEAENHIPISLLVKSMFLQFIRHPIECLFIFIVNKYCMLKADVNVPKSTIWEIDKSSRNNNEN